MAAISGLLLFVDSACAQSTSFERGGGFYLSLPKFIASLVVYLLWVWSADFVNRDAQRLRINYTIWNPIVVFVFYGALLLFWTMLPSFAVGFPVLLLAWLAPVITYVVYRNRKVQEFEKLLTPGHLRWVASKVLGKVGIKISADRSDPFEKGLAVKLNALTGKGSRENNVLLLSAKQTPGFWPTSELLAEGINNRADAMMIDVGAESTVIRFQVDGVWHDRDPMDVETGADILASLKTLAGCNPDEHRARQGGRFRMEFKGAKTNGRISCQGSGAGERGVVQYEHDELPVDSLEEAGMRPKMFEQLRELLRSDTGLIVFAGPPGSGLTTTIDLSLASTDRYMRNFASIEEKHKPAREIENITPTFYDKTAGQSPETVMEKLVRTYPDVIVCREDHTQASLAALCEQPGQNRLIIIGVKANDAAEGLLTPLVLKAPHQQYADVVTCVLAQRLIRKLCEKCREPVPPPPAVLKALRLKPEQLEAIYQPPVEENGCGKCNGIGYSGRTALYELLVVDNKVREVLKKKPQVPVVKQFARQAGLRSFQEEGLLLVAKGVTSVAELQRILKAG